MLGKCQLLTLGVGVMYSQVGLVLFPLGVREVAPLEWEHRDMIKDKGSGMGLACCLPAGSRAPVSTVQKGETLTFKSIQ